MARARSSPPVDFFEHIRKDAPSHRECASVILFFFSSRRRHTRSDRDWSSDVCSSDLKPSNRDPKKFRVFVVVSRPVLIDSRFSTVICAPVYSSQHGLSTQVLIGVEEGDRKSVV